MMNRDIDGVYFRIERDGEFQNLCFSDLTTEERARGRRAGRMSGSKVYASTLEVL